MKRSPLSRVENMLRRVVEEPFSWFGAEGFDPFQLATHLTRYYDTTAANEAPPNCFTIHVNPDDFLAIADDITGFERQVADYVLLMVERQGHHLTEAPVIRFVSDATEVNRRARIVASRELDGHAPDTEIHVIANGDPTQQAIQEADAFLIIQGGRHISLDRPITRIGRRMDNDIVLESPAVSRYHAQIRWRQGYFVLFDISSHGRTLVNGSQIQEHVLRPGDVISFSEILLVYGEGRDEGLSAPSVSEDEELDTTLLKPEE
jgi:hypothetical protein